MVTVVIDIDGVTIETQRIVERRLQKKGYDGFSLERILCYDFNKSLTNEGKALLESGNDSRYPNYCNVPREAIFTEFADPTIYEEVIETSITEWTEKLKAFVMLGKLMALPQFNIIFQSVSYSQEIADAKERALKRLFCSRDYTYLAVLDGEDKPIVDGTKYIIEDNIRVGKCCATSENDLSGKPLLLLVKKPWNNPVYDSTIGDNINTYNVSVSSLFEALKYIYERECNSGLKY